MTESRPLNALLKTFEMIKVRAAMAAAAMEIRRVSIVACGGGLYKCL